MSKTLVCMMILMAMASCTQRQGAIVASADGGQADSTATLVAVMPTMGCLPLYYAEATGIADSANVILVRYKSQMDIDTAMANGHVDIAYSDLVRIARAGGKCKPLASVVETISMIASKSLEATNIKQVKDRMIAVARYSVTDYWCDRMLDSLASDSDLYFCPQINNVALRGKMMSNGLLEATMMGLPYSEWAVMEGNTCLFQTNDDKPHLAAWTVADTTRDVRSEDFLSLVRTATGLLNDRLKPDTMRRKEALLPDTIRRILIREYEMPSHIVDSLQLPHVSLPHPVDEADIRSAKEWLQGLDAGK